MFRVIAMTIWAAMTIAALAQTPNDRTDRIGTGQMSVDDKFVKHALACGTFEVQASRLALQRSNDPEVKRIAQKMVEDHAKANQDLAKLAANRRITTGREQLDPVQAAMLNKLGQVPSAEFDECYICMQILAHEEALMCFRKVIKKGEDKEIKEWATKTTPRLREHLQMVKAACDYATDDGRHESLKRDHKDHDK